MRNNPLVSIIIPAFNAEELIGETLESVLAQSYGNLEVIVVDDGSTDATASVVTGFRPRISYYYQSNSGGCAVPRNTGIKHSSGEYLCFLDADDLIPQDRIFSQIAFLESHPEVGLVFSNYCNFKETGTHDLSHFETCPRLRELLRDKDELVLDHPRDLLAQENYGSACTFLMRRSLLQFEPGFEPSLRACEDFHFYFRLARHAGVGVMNRIGLLRRLHDDNMSGDKFKMLGEGIRSRSMLAAGERDQGTRSRLISYISDCHGFLARHQADRGNYLAALKEECRAVNTDFSLPRLTAGCKGAARTILMAAGLHRPAQQRSA